MGVQFFGQYLVARGEIDRFQLRQAVEHMQWLHRTLGELAERRGFMTQETVERVLLAQLQADARFGEIAMELGCLTQLELDELIEDQVERQVRIGEALVELGHLDDARLKELVAGFETEQSTLALHSDHMPPELASSPLALDVLDRVPKTALRTALLPLKLGIPTRWNGETPHPLRIAIAIRGESSIRLGLAADTSLGREIASGRLGNHSPAPEIVEDVLEMFIRTVAQLAARGNTLCEPERGTLPESGFTVPIASPSGMGVLVLDPA